MFKRSSLLLGGLILMALAGCDDANETPKAEPSSESTAPQSTPLPVELPEGAVQAYLSDWQEGDYAGMYGLLTPAAKEKMTEQQFAERYETVYETLKADNLVVEALPGSTSDQVTEETSVLGFDYRVRMDSVAGPIAFEQHGRLRKAQDGGETKWLIEWKPSLLFPGMEDGDNVRVQAVEGERGEIVDRAGDGLAVNGSAPQLGIVPGKLGEDAEGAKATIAAKLGMTVQQIDRKLGASWVKPELFVPIAVVSESAKDELSALPGVVIQRKQLRVYPLGEAAAHLTGYVGEINAEELEKRKELGYAVGDAIGKAGLEQLLEDELRGTDGVVATIIDGNGQRRDVLAEKPAVPGKTFQLSIDAELQRAIYDEVKADASSVAAMDPKSGEIAALLSTPSYDPNAFVRGISSAQYDAWNDDPRHPFMNRFARAYAPGSTFKLLTAAGGLDAGTLDPDEAKAISGKTWTKDKSWGKYYVTRVHVVSPVDLSKALIYSDNIYFAQAALAIGKTKFAETAAKFGIGERIPIEYPLVRSQLSNDGKFGGDIQLADSGYGQGQVAMTTLHVALAYSALANDGNIVQPVLTLSSDGANAPKTWKAQAMKPDTATLLRDDLIQAVSHPDSVGHGAYIDGAAIAGKTGTAELKASKDAEGQENGWFVGFDANDPKLLLSVMIEDVGDRGGSGYVAPIAKRILQWKKP
ncbi:penicillin-binding transpeptidase domain-containing protein [Cohnella sp. GCM10027633]|uniref:penicillin-binding transpeptidase domain-containing protein n=1 Tax=unclassified Cohnella TaxID=2636738 RepID=UPI00362540C7